MAPESGTTPASKLPPDPITQLRHLAHDLSNSLETIVQAAYLLGQARLDAKNKKWLTMLDQAAQDAVRINRSLREILRAQSARTGKPRAS